MRELKQHDGDSSDEVILRALSSFILRRDKSNSLILPNAIDFMYLNKSRPRL